MTPKVTEAMREEIRGGLEELTSLTDIVEEDGKIYVIIKHTRQVEMSIRSVNAMVGRVLGTRKFEIGYGI